MQVSYSLGFLLCNTSDIRKTYRAPHLPCRARQSKPKEADDRVTGHPDRSRVWQAGERRDGHAGRVQAASQDVDYTC